MKKYLYQDLYHLEETHWWHISKRHVVEKMIKKYCSVKNPKILDMGCGTGKNMENMQKFGVVYGLDNSKDALLFCKKRGLKHLIYGSSEKTTLESSSFDIITLLDLLEHTDDKKTLKEVNRILKKEGLLIITIPAFQWLWSQWDEVLHHKKRYTLTELQNILASQGFQSIQKTYMYSFLVLPAFITRKIKEALFKTEYPSDFQLSHPLINKIILMITKMEFLVSNFIPIPFGTSILIVAKKYEKKYK